MEARKNNSEKTGSSPELAAIASQAVEQALARHELSSEQLEEIVGEPQLIFEFFENLLVAKKKESEPEFNVNPDKQFFLIEALSGKCLKVDHSKLVTFGYRPRNFALEAAACFSGDSPATEETKVRAYQISGKISALAAATVISDNVKSLILTRAQIRHFCAKYADVILLRKMIPSFLFRRSELVGSSQEGLMVVTAYIDSADTHFSITMPEQLIDVRVGNHYLIVPVQISENDRFMIEAMEMYTGI